MLKIQNQYLDYLSAVEEEVSKTNLVDSVIDRFNFKESIKAISETELLIPVIGAFSAGKSSLLNSFLGENRLPEKITPETSLATELRYSENERIEAVGSNGNVEEFSIEEIEKIKDRAAEFKHLRMYLKNENIKKIEPLILVDIPGFESPLDLHNQTIMEYINRSVHYLILTSIEDGSLTKSMKRQPPATPKTNGMVKRVNCTIKVNSYKYLEDMKKDLNQFLVNYNSNRRHGRLVKELKVRTPYQAIETEIL